MTQPAGNIEMDEDLRDRAQSLAIDCGSCYLAYDNGKPGGDPNDVRYFPSSKWRTWDTIDDEELQRLWLSPNNMDPNTSLGIANKEAFLKGFGECDGIVETPFLGVGVRIATMTQAMWDMLAGMANYPVIDDTLYSSVEDERRREAWNDWVRGDWEGKIKDALSPPPSMWRLKDLEFELNTDDVNEDQWYWYFCDCLNEAGGEWLEESGSYHPYELEKAVTAVNYQALLFMGVRLDIDWEADSEEDDDVSSAS